MKADTLRLSPPQALRLPGLARAWSRPMANHPRKNVEKLIAGWKAADFSRRHAVPDPHRGYDAAYSNPDIERQSAIEQAEAAADLARKFLIKRIP